MNRCNLSKQWPHGRVSALHTGGGRYFIEADGIKLKLITVCRLISATTEEETISAQPSAHMTKLHLTRYL